MVEPAPSPESRAGRGLDRELRSTILSLLDARGAGSTICPSDAARAVHARSGETGDGWRELMEPARQAACRLGDAGEVVVTQRGEVVDASTARGPIRLRRAR